ncbi:MAG: hypothetical protein ACOCYT_05090 [Chloroflexota bacterium]
MAKWQQIRLGALAAALLMAIPLLLIVADVWNPNIRIGSVGSNFGDHISCRYLYFDDIEANDVNVEDSETLVVDYAITVDRGSLELRALHGDAVLWQQTFEQDAESQIEIDVSLVDRVRIQVIGHDAGGRFDVTWSPT